MKLPNIPLLVLDTETTGFVPRTHRVIEYACVDVKGGKVVETYEQLLSIPGEIPPHVQVITQIKNEDLAGKPTFAGVLPKISGMVTPGTLIVGQNVRFDIGMLKGEGWDLSEHPWIDTSMLASIVFPELSSYSLGYMSEILKLNHEPKHRALGDVHATLELLSKCWERLSELPADARADIASVAVRSPAGYRMLFEGLVDEPAGASRPQWLKRGVVKDAVKNTSETTVITPTAGSVQLVEEGLDPSFVLGCMEPSAKGKQRWVAVKNIEAWVRRFGVPDGACVLYPPELVLRPDAAVAFLKQEAFTEDEATLAMKLHLYKPSVRAQLPLHGDEHSVWTGKLACARGEEAYLKQVSADAPNVIVDHQELLKLAEDKSPLLGKNCEIVIDDASMLEDTATTAYGWYCPVAPLRAGAAGDPTLTKLVDLLEIWLEKTCSGTDLRYVVVADLHSYEAECLRDIIDQVRAAGVGVRVKQYLDAVTNILTIDNLPGRIVWMEVFQDGSRHLKSVPEDIAVVLKERLFDAHPTALLIPPGSAKTLGAILAVGTKTTIVPFPDPAVDGPAIAFPEGVGLQSLFAVAPTGKTVLLVGSKRIIEDVFVKHALRLEKEGVTLICQGFNGGQGRMQAEFAAAPAPAILVLTPWSYETFELPPNTVDRLLVQTLPFDHPSHAVIGRRAERFRDPFGEYSLPRLMHRLFRLLRTFCKHRTTRSTAEYMDERFRTKAYGKQVRAYLETLGMLGTPSIAPVPGMKPDPKPSYNKPQTAKPTKKPAAPKPPKPKADPGQMSLL
ncbi:MAG TPA: exonuclease domain-containing protein [Candidatus Peribacteria bacterium]|nr:exonuclease domain-containing protein [Candidatus Peribacteria bacterium]